MAERERQPATPKCPECGGREIDALASDQQYHRYQCKSAKCLHGWSVPRAPDVRAAIERHRLHNSTETEVTQMGKLKCEKGCGREFVHQKRKQNHEENCAGEASARRAPAARAPRPAPAPAREPGAGEISAPVTTALIHTISEVPEHLAGTPAGETMKHLIRQREMLRKEVSSIDDSLRTIERHWVVSMESAASA